MSTRRYLFDENVNPVIRKALQRDWTDIVAWQVGDPATPARGTLDPEILLWCEAKGFTLVTNNRKSMPVHLMDHLAAGGHVPGILILRRQMSIPEIVEELALIWLIATPNQYADKITFLPIS